MHNIGGTRITTEELGILYATKASVNAQSLQELAKRSRHTLKKAEEAINKLVMRGILRSIESYNDRIIFGYGESDIAQRVYCEIHDVKPIEEEQG